MLTTRVIRNAFVLMFLCVLLLTLPVIAGCSSDDTTENESATEQTETDAADEVEAGDEAEADTPAEVDEDVADEDADSGEDADAPETLTVMLYFASAGENAMGIQREIAYTQAVAGAAMEELLAGLTDDELAVWPALSSEVPQGTELLGLTIDNGVASVDLSDEFDDGGGSFSVTARVAQVVYTLCQFDSVDSVEFYMEGELIELFTGEGLEFDGPQTPEDYYGLLPIDA